MNKTDRIKLIIGELKKLKKQSTPMECDTINAVLECYLYPLQDDQPAHPKRKTERKIKLKIEPGKHIIAGQTKRGKQ